MVGTGKSDIESFLAQEQGARELESVGAAEGIALAESRYESKDLSSDRYLCKLLPISCEANPELFKLRVEQEPFPATASQGCVDLCGREARGGDRIPFRRCLAHLLGTRLRDIEFDQGAGIDEKDQRRSSRIISEANLPRFGKAGP